MRKFLHLAKEQRESITAGNKATELVRDEIIFDCEQFIF